MIDRRGFLRGILGIGAGAVVATAVPRVVAEETWHIDPDSPFVPHPESARQLGTGTEMRRIEQCYSPEGVEAASKIAEQIKAVFSVLDPIGGWPEGADDWTEEECDDYYDEHSPLNIKPPPLTKEQFDKRLDERQETNDRVMEWLAEGGNG